MSDGATAGRIPVGEDGFAEHTPAEAKAILSAYSPNPGLVDRYMHSVELGKVRVPLDKFEAHALQRPINQDHVEALALALLDSNQNRDFPCLVVAQEVPVPKARWDDTPFVNEEGVPVKVWVLHGNHRFHALERAVEISNAQEGRIPMQKDWFCVVLHPCFLAIHEDHVRRLIVRDNIMRESAKMLLPERNLVHLNYALGVYSAVIKEFGLTPEAMSAVKNELEHLELFKGGWSKPGVQQQWKLGLRVVMRSFRATEMLRMLMRMPGVLQRLDDEELGRFLVNLGQKGKGLEPLLAILFRSGALAQQRLNITYAEKYPGGFDINEFFFDVGRMSWDEYEEYAASQRPKEVPSKEQWDAFKHALRTGEWGELVECYPLFAKEFHHARFLDEEGHWVDVEEIPNVHLAGIPGGRQPSEMGLWIELLHRARAGVRTMCLILWGPHAIRTVSDVDGMDALMNPATFISNQGFLVHRRLAVWAKQRRLAGNIGDLIEQTFLDFSDSDQDWAVPAFLWEEIRSASDGVLGQGGEPVPKFKGLVSKEGLTRIAGVVNRILGIPAWHGLMMGVWGLTTGDAYSWAKDVRITAMSPEEIELGIVQQSAMVMVEEEREKASVNVKEMQSQLMKVRERLKQLGEERKVAEGYVESNLQTVMARLEKKKDKAYERWALVEAELTEGVMMPMARIEGEIEVAEKRREKLKEDLKRSEDAVKRLDADGMTVQAMRQALEQQGRDLDIHPLSKATRTVARAVSPPVPTQGATDEIAERVKNLFLSVSDLLPWEVRRQLGGLARQCADKGVARELMRAMIQGLRMMEEELETDTETEPETAGAVPTGATAATPKKKKHARDDPKTPGDAAAKKRSRVRQGSPTRGAKDSVSDAESDGEEGHMPRLDLRRDVGGPKNQDGKVLVPETPPAKQTESGDEGSSDDISQFSSQPAASQS